MALRYAPAESGECELMAYLIAATVPLTLPVVVDYEVAVLVVA